MIKYRPNRSSLAESIAEIKEFNSVDELKSYVIADWHRNFPMKFFTSDDIIIGDVQGNDGRFGWKNVRQVSVKRIGSEDYIKMYGCPYCLGWCGE